jgi:ERCC4-type nuclease
LRGIGSATADRLRENDLVTKKDIRSVSINELRNIPGVGETSIKSLKNAV